MKSRVSLSRAIAVALAVAICVFLGLWIAGQGAGRDVIIVDTTVATDQASKLVAETIKLLQTANTMPSDERLRLFQTKRMMYLDPPIRAKELGESGPYTHVRIMDGWGYGRIFWVEKRYVHPVPAGK